MASTKTYTLTEQGIWTAQAQDSSGTYESSEISNAVNNLTMLQFNISTLSGWSSVSAGSHTLTIKAKASGYKTSNPSTGVSVTKTVNYTITGSATNCFINGNTTYSATVAQGSSVTLNLTANGTTYKLPTSLTVTDGVYNRTSDTAGTLTITPTQNVTFSVIAQEKASTYTVTGSATNCSINGSSSYSGTISSSGTLTLTLRVSKTHYILPDEVSGGLPASWSCSGATMSYTKTNSTSGSITITNPSSNVEFYVCGEYQLALEFDDEALCEEETDIDCGQTFVSNGITYDGNIHYEYNEEEEFGTIVYGEEDATADFEPGYGWRWLSDEGEETGNRQITFSEPLDSEVQNQLLAIGYQVVE